MINFYYHPGYVKRKKKIITNKLHESVIVNKLIDFTYFFNFTFPNRLITNGTHKCMNNTLKALKQNTKSSYNKEVYLNSYILQFDWYGEKVLNQLLKNNVDNKKVLIGPLFTDEQLKRLSKYIEDFEFIKIVVASNSSVEYILNNKYLNIKRENICIVPTGVISKKKLLNLKNKKRSKECLIYFKNRNQKDLVKVIEVLKSKNISYKLFQYGKYENNNLVNAASKSKFCIMINGSESQGLAVQEILTMNLPIYVWDIQYDNLNNFKSSVSYFDDRCGMIVNSFKDLVNNFELFLKKLNSYKPNEIILEELTFEKFIQNLNSEFYEFK